MLYSFAGLTLSSTQRILTSGSSLIPLPPKAVSVLIVLVERVGQVVSRETLREEVWGKTFVEDTAITRSISQLRSALQPYLADGEGIETLSKRGYRFTASVTATEESESVAEAPAAADGQPESAAEDVEADVPGVPEYDSSLASPEHESLAEAVPRESSLARAIGAGQSVRARRSPLYLSIAAAVLVALAVLAVRGYRAYRSEHVQARQQQLAVVDFRDLSGTAGASWIGIAMQESLSQALARDGGITTLSGDQVAVAEEDLGLSHARTFDAAELDQLDRRLGVEYLLTGIYMPLGEQVRLDLVLHKGDKVVTEFNETVEQGDLQATVERAGAQMRVSLRLPQAQTGGELQFFGKNQVAERFYAEGLGLSRTGDTPRLAREAFSKAVQADPQFAEAHAALALAWSKTGHEADSRAEAQLALDTCGSLPETRKLSLQASAYKLLGNGPKSLEALTRLRQLHPDDQLYKFRMASTLFNMARYADAAVLLRQIEADKTRPPNLPALQLLATTLTQQGDRSAKFMYADRIMKLAKAEGSRSAEAQAHLFAGMGWMGARDGAKAVAEFNQGEKLSAAIGDKVGVISALTDETAARMQFHMPGAMAVGQRAIDIAADIGRDGTIAAECINLGSVAMYASQLRSATSYYKRALQLGEATEDKTVRQAATNGLASVYMLSENLAEAEKTATLELQYAQEAADQSDAAVATLHLAEVDAYLGRWAPAESRYKQAAESMQRGGNPPGANDVLVEYAWMLMQRGTSAKAAEVFRTIDLRVLQDNESLAGYMQGHLANTADDPKQAVIVVNKALAKDLVPYRTATGLDVLMEIAVRQKDSAGAHAVAERYAALTRSIPEDGAVRRGAVRAAAEAEILAGNRKGDAIRNLPLVLQEAARLSHLEEVAELKRVLAESRK